MKFLKILGKFFAVIFSIVFFFVLTGFMSALFARNITSANYYSDVIENIDLDTMKVSDLNEFFDIGDLDPDATLEDALIDALTEESGDAVAAKSLVNNKEIRSIVGKFLGDFINYYLGGEKPNVSKKDLETILTNSDYVKLAGERPTQKEIDNIYNDIVDGLEEAKENLKESGGEIGNTRNREEYINPIR